MKPNFVDPDPGLGTRDGDYALYLGRLIPEKAVDLLAQAWLASGTSLALVIAGSGPLADHLAALGGQIRVLGQISHADSMGLLGSAKFLCAPTRWHEPFGRSTVEAFARGVPVLASTPDGGSCLVEDDVTGKVVPSTLTALVDTINLMSEDASLLTRLSSAARMRYLRDFTATGQAERLVDIYQRAIHERSLHG